MTTFCGSYQVTRACAYAHARESHSTFLLPPSITAAASLPLLVIGSGLSAKIVYDLGTLGYVYPFTLFQGRWRDSPSLWVDGKLTGFPLPSHSFRAFPQSPTSSVESRGSVESFGPVSLPQPKFPPAAAGAVLPAGRAKRDPFEAAAPQDADTFSAGRNFFYCSRSGCE